jgi:hypothetical protein
MLMPSRFMAEITPVLSPKSRIPRRQHLRLHPQPAALFLRPRLHLSRAHRKFLLTRSSGERVGSLATCREGIAGVQNLDFTVITNTRFISGRISSSTAAAVAGLNRNTRAFSQLFDSADSAMDIVVPLPMHNQRNRNQQKQMLPGTGPDSLSSGSFPEEVG